MAISVVKVPNSANNDQDFIAFSFNGKHSYDDFGIIRTIDGDRYNENLAPALEDKTAEVPGGDGQYYFGTLHKTKTFNVSIAFENMTERKFREMKQWLNGKELGGLWFSEAPYKVWTAKVVGTPVLKYIPFEINGQRVYRGEGSIQFTAYWPYAHTPDLVEGYELHLKQNQEFFFEAPLKCQYLYLESGLSDINEKLTFYAGSTALTKTNKGSTMVQFSKEQLITSIKSNSNVSVKIYTADSTGTNRTLWKWSAYGKRAQAYNSFGSTDEWLGTSGLEDGRSYCTGENPGDVPTTFTLTYATKNGDNSANKTFKVGDLSITIDKSELAAGNQIIWDSKTGLVTKKVGTTETLISYTGTGCGAIPVNGLTSAQLNLQGGTLNYHYWYY